MRFLRFVVAGLGIVSPLVGEGLPITELTVSARRSLVAIHQGGRTGAQEAVGSGFVVREDGLIATNLHVIGEGRAITVELPDGTTRPVTEVHAWDRTLDLAVIKIDAAGLAPLSLGDSAALADGTRVIALGAPQGLRASVVEGVVSARRDVPEFPGVPLLQIAMPIEPGNSGGPVLSLDGQVQGVITMRSLRAPNLGFAMPSAVLKVLLEKPNPVAIGRWRTIGTLDRESWEMIGAQWTQRAGEIKAGGRGPGFGGRALCLWQDAPAPSHFDLSVRVKLDDESGAAGLAFCADGADRHYGFYPTNGMLRLTRFEGPDVFSWTVLEEVRSPHYRPGNWNDLHVRVDPDRITCFLNGEKVIESTDATWRGGRAGLCKFRESGPAFRAFRLAPPAPPSSHDVLISRAGALEEEAGRLRDRARREHQSAVQSELVSALAPDDESAIDLPHAALLIARFDDPEFDPAPCRERIRRLGDDFRRALGPDSECLPVGDKITRLNEFFFRDNGFHGARFDYENRANSHLNEVLDDREGIPITLCLLYAEIGRQAGLDIVGVSRPGQFVVRVTPPADQGPPLVIDVFEHGAILDEPETASLPAAGKREIILRMINNLKNFSLNARQTRAALGYASLAVALSPAHPRERLARAWLAAWENDWDTARSDIETLRAQSLDEAESDHLDQLIRLVAGRAPANDTAPARADK